LTGFYGTSSIIVTLLNEEGEGQNIDVLALGVDCPLWDELLA